MLGLRSRMEVVTAQEVNSVEDISSVIDSLEVDPMLFPYVQAKAVEIGQSDNSDLITKAIQILSEKKDAYRIFKIWEATNLKRDVFNICKTLDDFVRERLVNEIFIWDSFKKVDDGGYRLTDLIDGLTNEASIKRDILRNDEFRNAYPISSLRFAFDIEDYEKGADLAVRLFNAAFEPRVKYENPEINAMFEGVLNDKGVQAAIAEQIKTPNVCVGKQWDIYQNTIKCLAEIVGNRVGFLASKARKPKKAYNAIADKLAECKNCGSKEYAARFYLLAKNYKGFTNVISHFDRFPSFYLDSYIALHRDLTNKKEPLSKVEQRYFHKSEKILSGIASRKGLGRANHMIAAASELNRYDLLVNGFWELFEKGDFDEDLYSFLNKQGLVQIPDLYSKAIGLFSTMDDQKQLDIAIKVADMAGEIIPGQLMLHAIQKVGLFEKCFAITIFDYLIGTSQMPERYMPLYQSLKAEQKRDC